MTGQKRKMSENQLKNLEKGKNYFARSKEIARNAQIEAIKKRKENQSFQEIMNMRLENIDEESGLTNKVAIVDALINKAKLGDKQAAEFVRDTAGEKPSENKVISGSLDIQKVFISADEKEATDKHIEQFIDESLSKEG